MTQQAPIIAARGRSPPRAGTRGVGDLVGASSRTRRQRRDLHERADERAGWLMHHVDDAGNVAVGELEHVTGRDVRPGQPGESEVVTRARVSADNGGLELPNGPHVAIVPVLGGRVAKLDVNPVSHRGHTSRARMAPAASVAHATMRVSRNQASKEGPYGIRTSLQISYFCHSRYHRGMHAVSSSDPQRPKNDSNHAGRRVIRVR